MVEATGAPIVEYFAALDDPRIDRTKRHKLLDIVTIAICGTICGADNWVDIELFGNCKEEWFKSFLELPNGIPSHDTFGDVFARLDPEQFQHCFIEWVQAVAQLTQGEVVAIDGKTVRRSHDRTLGKGAIHMVNVWASSNGLLSPLWGGANQLYDLVGVISRHLRPPNPNPATTKKYSRRMVLYRSPLWLVI